MTLSTGTRLGPYEILSPLGSGGMGEVFKARDTRLGRDVAVKVLPDHLRDDPKALARFENEARAVAALSHPHILALHDVGRVDSTSFAVTELLEGESLRSLLSRGSLPVRRALDVARQVADALAAAHDKGIVHRDLKPENVFLTSDRHAKVLDFGLARFDPGLRDSSDSRSPTASLLTHDGEVLGTVPYMSPEQARGLRVDHRSDQFSLGSLLYEMLSGKRPFRGATPADTLAAIIRDEPEPLSRLLPALPPQLLSLLDRCLAKEPEARYVSTRDLARDLDACFLRLSGSPGGITAPASAGAGEGAGRPTARRWLFLAAGLAAALLLTAVALLLVRSRSAAPPIAKSASSAGAPALEPKRVVVAVFENRTGDKELDDLGTILSEWLTDGLAAAGFCQIVPTPSVVEILRHSAKTEPEAAEQLRDLARRTGSGLIVSGAVYAAGDQIRIQARIGDAVTGKLVHAVEPAVAPRQDPMNAVDAVKRRVLDVVAARLLDHGGTVLDVEAKPPKYEAFRQKLAGEAIALNSSATAIEHFQKALEIDPDYSGARLSLVVEYIQIGRWAEASSSLEPLERLRASLTPPVAAEVQRLRAWLRGRFEEALVWSREQVRIAPGDALSAYKLGNDAYHADRPREALAALRRPVDWSLLLAPDSPYGPWYFHYVAASLHALGKHEEELSEALRSRGLYPDVGLPRVDEVRALVALGRLDELDRQIDEAARTAIRGDGATPGTVMRFAVQELRAHGRKEAALAVANRHLGWLRRLPGPSSSGPERQRVARIRLAIAFVLCERWTEARDVLLELAKADPADVEVIFRLPWVTLRAGDLAEAARLDAALGRMTGEFLFGQPAFARACNAAALSRKEDAVEFLRDALGQGFPPIGAYSPGETLRHRVELESLRGFPPFEELLKPKE